MSSIKLRPNLQVQYALIKAPKKCKKKKKTYLCLFFCELSNKRMPTGDRKGKPGQGGPHAKVTGRERDQEASRGIRTCGIACPDTLLCGRRGGAHGDAWPREMPRTRQGREVVGRFGLGIWRGSQKPPCFDFPFLIEIEGWEY